jgi:hypothetical protein
VPDLDVGDDTGVATVEAHILIVRNAGSGTVWR